MWQRVEQGFTEGWDSNQLQADLAALVRGATARRGTETRQAHHLSSHVSTGALAASSAASRADGRLSSRLSCHRSPPFGLTAAVQSPHNQGRGTTSEVIFGSTGTSTQMASMKPAPASHWGAWRVPEVFGTLPWTYTAREFLVPAGVRSSDIVRGRDPSGSA